MFIVQTSGCPWFL